MVWKGELATAVVLVSWMLAAAPCQAATTIKPLEDRILVQPLEAEQARSD